MMLKQNQGQNQGSNWSSSFRQPFSKRIREICDGHGLVSLIEDAAQAHGAILDGKMAEPAW